MINCCRIFITFWLISSLASKSHGGCFVHPTGSTVRAGERVSLTCSTNEGYSISSWQIGKDAETMTSVYAAPVYKPDGTVRTPQNLAEGYNVSRPGDNETVLHINKATLSQAGSYVCTCDDPSRSTDTSIVVVLESEPKFSTDRRVSIGEPVIFSCSISFNGSSDVSCDLTIEDAFGYTVAGQTSVTVKNNLTFCNLKHSIIANASSDQSHTCNVTLTTTRKDVIYSQVLKAVGEWQPVSVAEFELLNPDECSAERCTVGSKLWCKAHGYPRPTAFRWWKFSENGEELVQTTGNDSQYLVLNEVGRSTYQCHASNVIRNTVYLAISKNVPIDVASEDLRVEANRCDSELGLRIGIAISCAIIVIFGSVIMLLYRKLLQKSRSTTDHRIQDSAHKTTPASYMTLNIKQSSEEMQRDVYTEIQLPT